MSETNEKAQRSTEQEGGTLGTFGGVFTPSILTILGIILFLRLGFVVGSAGLVEAFAILGIATAISVLTSISLSAVATNMRVKGGGDYYLISRTLGVGFGGAIGTVLFLAQAVSIAFYSIGFGEAVAAMIGTGPAWTAQAISAGAVVMLFLLAWVGSDWATRFQFVIMAILGAALVSFTYGAYGSWDKNLFYENLGPSSDTSFWVLFAIFFPAVTGFTQGVSMSGDLKNPSKSIPRGTFLAVGLSTLIYIGVAILFAGALSGKVLIEDYNALKRISHFGWLASAGVIAATLSSALASFLGAPRILQSLAQDKVFPFLGFFAQGHGATNNPRRGVALSCVIALITVALGDLNVIAPIVSMFFLISYGLLNYATYSEARGKSPSFRPRFRWFHARLSLAGAISCLGAMLMLDARAGAVAMAVLFAIYHYVSTRKDVDRWADSNRSNRFQRVRQDLHSISNELAHPRDWRPMLLAFSEDEQRRERILTFSNWIEGGSGLTTAVFFVEGEGAVGRKRRADADARLRKELVEKNIEAFPLVVATSDVEAATYTLLQTHGLGPVKPNTIILSWYDREEIAGDRPGLRSFGRYLQMGLANGCNNVILCATAEEFALLEEKKSKGRRIDVLYQGDATGRLMLLFAYLMTRTTQWEGAKIRLLCERPEDRTEAEALAELKAMLEEVRIEATAEVIDGLTPRRLVEKSADASLVFLPFRLTNGQPVSPFEKGFDELLEFLPVTALVLASQELDLQAQPEDGLHGEISMKLDDAERCATHAAQAEVDASAALEAARKAELELETARSQGGVEDAIAALETAVKAAEEEATRLRRRAAKARAKAADAAFAAQSLIGDGSQVPEPIKKRLGSMSTAGPAEE